MIISKVNPNASLKCLNFSVNQGGNASSFKVVDYQTPEVKQHHASNLVLHNDRTKKFEIGSKKTPSLGMLKSKLKYPSIGNQLFREEVECNVSQLNYSIMFCHYHRIG